MGAIEILSLALTHPNEFRILLQFWNFYLPKRDITKKEEHPTSGWDRPTMRRCWELLDHSSRSFSAVIKELDGDLARVVSLPLQPRLHLVRLLCRKFSRRKCGLPSFKICPIFFHFTCVVRISRQAADPDLDLPLLCSPSWP